MASRKDEKERRRQERLAREEERQAAAEKRRRAVYVMGGVLAAAAIVVVVVLAAGSGGGGEKTSTSGETIKAIDPPPLKIADLDQAAKKAGCTNKQYREEGREHLPPGSKLPKYKTNPPTSGNHDPEAAHDAAAGTAPPIGKALHAMEHGRILIQYSDAIPMKRKQQLKGLFEEISERILLYPNATDMPYEVAATAWTRILGCKKVNDATFDAIRAFTKAYRDKGPELILQPE